MKIHSIQYLRAVAALMVALAHSFLYLMQGENYDLRRFANFGVLIFFVISGFIMVIISGEGKISSRRFLERRILRVVPLYWLVTAGVALGAIVVPQMFKTTQFSLDHFVLSLLFVPHYDANQSVSPLLKLGWTLNYEMFFYLCFALLGGLSGAWRVVILTALFAGLAIVGQTVSVDNAIFEFYTGQFLLTFCCGMLVGLAALRFRLLDGSLRWLAIVGVLAIAFVAAGFGLERGTRGGVAVTLMLSLAGTAILLFTLGLESRLGQMKLPELLGDASYSIYLVHMYVVGVVALVWTKLFDGAFFVLGGIVTFAAASVAGVLVYLWLEKPLLAWINNRRRGGSSDASKAVMSVSAEDSGADRASAGMVKE